MIVCTAIPPLPPPSILQVPMDTGVLGTFHSCANGQQCSISQCYNLGVWGLRRLDGFILIFFSLVKDGNILPGTIDHHDLSLTNEYNDCTTPQS